jgi:class 3 adenylate cyclase/pimeloyl-ACP methyl ester carboxylesterase
VHPETRYTHHDGAQIAYQVFGAGPIDLVYMSGFASQLDLRWDDPHAERFLTRLASFSRVITFDRRGAGLSDPLPSGHTPGWEEWTHDLTTVLDEVGSERSALFALYDAGPVAMLFAASHPERTTALILGNTGARISNTDDYDCAVSRDQLALSIDALEQTWGTEALAETAAPVACRDPELRRWFARFMRASASPRAIAAQMRAIADSDFRPALRLIRVPTLVLHRSEFMTPPIAGGRYLAEHIAGARFVEVPGKDSSFWWDGADLVLDEVQEFLTGRRSPQGADRVLRTVLFTDVVGSTERLAQLGDKRWKSLLDRHDQLVEHHAARHLGRVVERAGDGVLATFEVPGAAIRCAVDLRRDLAALGLDVRAGMHAGEVELRGERIGGIAVHIAARVAALAGAGDVLVSRTVADLVAGSNLRLTDRGTHPLKGVPGEWQVFAAET